jgi:hypothetical protein
MIVAVHLNLIVGSEFHFEDAHVLVLKNEMMMGLGCDVDCRGLGESEQGRKKKDGNQSTFHRVRF